MKISRNEKCPCGSGKKYKKCCLNKIVNPIRPKPPRVITHLTYEEVFSENSDEKYEQYMNELPAIESICAAAYINMILQTTSFDIAQEQQINDARRFFANETIQKKFADKSKIIVHRDTLLVIIQEALKRKAPRLKDIDDSERSKLLESFLLANSRLNMNSSDGNFDLERGFIRNPDVMNPDSMEWYFKHSFLRYSAIFSDFIGKLSPQDMEFWKKVEDDFMQSVGVSLREYMNTIKLLLTWFLISRNSGKGQGHGYNPKDPKTFYILEDNFKENQSFIDSLKSLSKEIDDYEVNNPKIHIDNNSFKLISEIFDNPVLEVESGRYCILDLTYFLENSCGGLLYRLSKDFDMQTFKGVYGNLLELYFNWLIKEIFGENAEITADQDGSPDAIITVEIGSQKYKLVIEFCTKYYRLESLYNISATKFTEDLNNLFFNEDRDGKFLKLNTYIDNLEKNDDDIIVPILLTERYVGDMSLLNRIDQFVDKGIENNDLEHLSVYKPIILSLLDLETYWAGTIAGEETEDFVNELLAWEKVDKGPHLFKFANFSSNPSREKRMNNEKYLSIFNINNIFTPNQ